MGTAISCTEYSQVAGLIQKVDIEAPQIVVLIQTILIVTSLLMCKSVHT